MGMQAVPTCSEPVPGTDLEPLTCGYAHDLWRPVPHSGNRFQAQNLFPCRSEGIFALFGLQCGPSLVVPERVGQGLGSDPVHVVLG